MEENEINVAEENELDISDELLKNISIEGLADLKIEVDDMVTKLQQIIKKCDDCLNSYEEV